MSEEFAVKDEAKDEPGRQGKAQREKPDTAPLNLENIRCEYNHALEIAQHSDAIIHEVAAIVWGANTLLLGFILEVPCESDNQKLVIVASIVGLMMSLYVPAVHILVKRGQKIAYKACQDIEKEFPFKYKLHTAIEAVYPKWKPGWVAVLILTAAFLAGWGYVMHHAANCLGEARSTHSDFVPTHNE